MSRTDLPGGLRNRGLRHDEYEYDPLPDNQRSIRLLNLLGSEVYDAEIECEVFNIDFRREEQLAEPYEAVSWRWGSLPATQRITIRWHQTQKRVRKSKLVSPDLLAALRAFRYRDRDRSLWIDQICIDQKNPVERSSQVGLMSEIYGRATTVRVWLGPADETSPTAIRFVNEQLSPLRTFDELCRDENAYGNWRALYSLLQRPWFSRRWVVQEIALARSAMVHCGDDQMSWKDLAIAVELFVEAESRLSRTLEREPRFHRVLGDLKDISALGASLLVDATNKVFRGYWDLDWEGEAGADSEALVEHGDDVEGSTVCSDQDSMEDIDQLKKLSTRSLREPLLTLEYLVSSLSLFGVTTPHDAIYSLLAIAKDTYPFIEVTSTYANRNKMLLRTVLEKFTQQQMYRVDYEHEFADVCKSFVQFCINASNDHLRALDITCRPWAPVEGNKLTMNGYSQRPRGINPRFKAGQQLRRDMARRQSENESADEILDESSGVGWTLPSWVASLSNAAYTMYSVNSSDALMMGRKNGDPLVGLPDIEGAAGGSYNASKPRGIDLKTLRFARRSRKSIWSMYTQGFELDVIREVQLPSQGGAIPRKWAIASGWMDVPKSAPPDDFWRTLVAGRGRDNKNPPAFYARACRETFSRGGIASGLVNTTDVINKEGNSPIAEFCRRVQAVVWNRSLFTTNHHRLGLTSPHAMTGDRVCILYGCSVPVVLRRFRKTPADVEVEARDELENLKTRLIGLFRQRGEARAQRLRNKNLDWALDNSFEYKMQRAWNEDRIQGREAWLRRFRLATIRPDDQFVTYFHVTMPGEPEEFVVGTSKNFENVEQVLERRAYRAWKDGQRTIPLGKGFKRSDRVVAGLQIHWFRRWKRIYEKRKALRATLSQNTNGSDDTEAASPDSDGNEPGYDFDEHFIAEYIKPFKGDPNDQTLKEPNWDDTDEESLRLQARWSYFKFVGECYVDGMMDGEAVAHQYRERIPPMTFELQ